MAEIARSIITPEMRAVIGVESEPRTYEVSAWDLARFACAIGDPNPAYSDEKAARDGAYGGLIAPPTFFRSLLPGPYPRWFDEPFAHILDGGSSYCFHHPVRAGDRVTVVRKLVDLFEKGGRLGPMLFKVAEIRYANQLGQLVATQTTTTITYGTGPKDPGVGDH